MNFTYQFVKRLEKFVLWLFVADCAIWQSSFSSILNIFVFKDTLEHWCKANFIMFPFVLSNQEAESLKLLNQLNHSCSKLSQSSGRCYNFYFVDIERELCIETNK